MKKTTIMFAGPHGIGKTTTAQKLAEKANGFEFKTSIAGQVAKDTGFNLCEDPDYYDVTEFQKELLTKHNEIYEAQTGNCIYDRSPLDFAAYHGLAFERHVAGSHNVGCLGSWVTYYQRCLEAAIKHSTHIIIPEADLTEEYPEKYGRPSFSVDENMARQRFYSMVYGYSSVLKNAYDKEVLVVPVEYQYDDRVDYILKQWSWLNE